MVKKLGLVFVLLLLASCSGGALSKNMIKRGETTFSGGNSGNISWNEVLTFNRVSWYQDFNLLFDSLLWEVDSKSKFMNWLSKKEKSYLNSCDKFYVVLTYNLDGSILSENDFFKQLDSQGADYIELTHFKSNITMHPHYDENSLNAYKVGGLCYKGSSNLVVNFPGFTPQKLN